MINVTVIEKSALSERICRLRLQAVDNTPLPAATPGAHIDVQLANGMIRQYSLCQAVGTAYYEIAVLNEPTGRGGSQYLHSQVNVGDVLQISAPKNLFPLAAAAQKTLLLAAGVGITPILSMAEALAAQGADFCLHYCAKSPEQTAFKQRIETTIGAKTQFHFSQNNQRINLEQVIQDPQAGYHLYVCGPVAFNDAVINVAMSKGWPSECIHREYFSAAPIDHSNDGSFEIEIKSSGEVFTVAADETILTVLEDKGFFIPVACEEGVCGTCTTGLLSGEAEHKDVFMTEEEHASMTQITPCCSRARSQRLVLDL